MKLLIALGAAGIAGAIAYRCVPSGRRAHLASDFKTRVRRRVERVMAELPENSPPKLIMNVLPKLKAQNEQIIELLREQNELLRKHEPGSEAKTAA